VVDWGREFAGGQDVEGAEAGVEFGGGQAAVAVKRAEEVGGGALSFRGIAVEAGRDEVAVGVATGFYARDDMVEALDASVNAAQAIEAEATFAEVDGLAEGAGLEEVELFEVDRRIYVGCGFACV
jgi:hypothetical protein